MIDFSDVAVKCSPSTRKLIIDYADKMHIPMQFIVDDAISDWMQTVGSARLEGLTKSVPLSQNENSA